MGHHHGGSGFGGGGGGGFHHSGQNHHHHHHQAAAAQSTTHHHHKHHHHHDNGSDQSNTGSGGFFGTIYNSIWKSRKNQSNKKKELKDRSKETNGTVSGDKKEVESNGIDTDSCNPQKCKKAKDSFFSRSCTFLSRSSSKKPQTPKKPSIAKSASQSANISAPAVTFVRSKSTRNMSETRNLREVGPDQRNRGRSSPIVYSHSMELKLKKPPPIEKRLDCTLEDLCHGCIKKINVTRDVISKTGQLQKEDETLQIRVKPGWKKGTRITFERKGDERPGTLPADIIFTVHEQRHSCFTRNGDDLEIVIEIPLLKALTGCTLAVPLLGSDKKMTLSLDNVIYPGFEKIIKGQGMPNLEDGKRGDLRVKFLVKFPTELSEEQRLGAYNILKDCC